jgi:hypothetical protein
MKKFNSITAILVCIAFVVQLQAQPDVMPEIENVLKEGQKSMTLPDFLDLLGLDGKSFEDTYKIKNVQYYSYKKQFPYNRVSFQTKWFDFAFLTDTRQRILFSSVELLGVKTEDKRIFNQVHVDFQSFIDAHEAFYNIKVNIEDENMSPLKDFKLFIDSDMQNQKFKEMIILINNRDITQLEYWLKSMNPTIQAYAVIAFDILDRYDANFKLTKQQEKIIKHIKAMENDIDFRSNFDPTNEIALNIALSDSYLETYWYIVKDSDLLK